MKRALVTVMGLVALVLCWPAAPVRSAAALDFVEKVLGPKSDQPLPLLIALHGLGDTPERFSALYEGIGVPVRLIAPRAPDPWGEASSWFPIDDKTREATVLVARAKLVADFAVKMTKERKPRGLPVVTGFSQGGCLSFTIAAYHSAAFAAALPIAGMMAPPMPAPRKARAGFRVIAFHGEADRRIALSDGRRTAERLKKAGTDVSFTSYPGLGHGVSPALERDYLAALREMLAGS